MTPLLTVGGCLLVSLVWNYLFWNRSYGIGMLAFAVAVMVFLALGRRLRFAGNAPTLCVHLALVLYLAATVSLYRNDLILGATVPAIYVGLAAIVFTGRNGYSVLNALGVAESIAGCAVRWTDGGPGTLHRAAERCFGNEPEGRTTSYKVVWGVLISIPFLVLFGWLFCSADPLFQGKVESVVDFIWQPDFWVRAVVVLAMGGWICGYLDGTAARVSLVSRLDAAPPKQKYDGVATMVFLLMINLLFLSFITIQLEYLFGGESVIRHTALTYAGYAHRGFYELWAVAVLVSAVIAVTNRGLRESTPRVRRWLELAWVALIAQTVVIIASSLKRIGVYEEAYGYTQLRILVALFQVWMAVAFVLFVFKIFGRRSFTWLASGAICAALVFLVGVSTFSIDQFIARKNVDRHLHGGETIDTEYLARLSADAYPELVRLRDETRDAGTRSAVEKILAAQQKQAEENLTHWSSWNRSLVRAREGQ